MWLLEPSLTDPNTVYAGVEDAALFRTTDGGQTWQEFGSLRDVKGNLWQPGAGGMCLHTIIQDPLDANRLVVTRRSKRGGLPRVWCARPVWLSENRQRHPPWGVYGPT